MRELRDQAAVAAAAATGASGNPPVNVDKSVTSGDEIGGMDYAGLSLRDAIALAEISTGIGRVRVLRSNKKDIDLKAAVSVVVAMKSHRLPRGKYYQ